MGRYQSINANTNKGKAKSLSFKRVSIHNISIYLLKIGYIINYQRSDGKQEEDLNLNTISLWGGAAHLTHTKGKHLGNNHNDALPGDDETYARTLPKQGNSIPNKAISNQDTTAEIWKEVNAMQ